MTKLDGLILSIKLKLAQFKRLHGQLMVHSVQVHAVMEQSYLLRLLIKRLVLQIGKQTSMMRTG